MVTVVATTQAESISLIRGYKGPTPEFSSQVDDTLPSYEVVIQNLREYYKVIEVSPCRYLEGIFERRDGKYP